MDDLWRGYTEHSIPEHPIDGKWGKKLNFSLSCVLSFIDQGFHVNVNSSTLLDWAVAEKASFQDYHLALHPNLCAKGVRPSARAAVPLEQWQWQPCGVT
jgi:hypothetical protein